MHAYLITGEKEEKRKQEAINLAQKKGFRPLFFSLAKIAEIRDLGNLTRLKGEKLAIIAPSIEGASDEALNAFLKNLEEPAPNILYILGAKTKHSLPETIVSRCLEIKLIAKELQKSKEISTFFEMEIDEKLEFMKQYKDRKKAIAFLEDLIEDMDQSLKKGETLVKKAKNIKLSQKTREALQANGNVNLQLLNLVLGLV